MKIYISGPISSCEFGNKPAFDRMASKLRQMRHEVVNPHDLDLINKVITWEDNLKRDIHYLLNCDAVVLLPGWEKSRGAVMEVGIAYDLGMKFYYVREHALMELPIVIDREVTPLFTSDLFEKI